MLISYEIDVEIKDLTEWFNRLKDFIKLKGGKIKYLCEQAGVSRSHFYLLCGEEGEQRTTAETVKKIIDTAIELGYASKEHHPEKIRTPNIKLSLDSKDLTSFKGILTKS